MTKNSDVAWSYFELLGEGRVDEALDLLDDEGTHWSMMNRTTMPLRQLKRGVRTLWERMPMRFTRHNALDAGDQAVLELESHATRPDGKPYNNVYCLVVTVADGKITYMREYLDSVVAKDAIASLGGWPPT